MKYLKLLLLLATISLHAQSSNLNGRKKLKPKDMYPYLVGKMGGITLFTKTMMTI